MYNILLLGIYGKTQMKSMNPTTIHTGMGDVSKY